MKKIRFLAVLLAVFLGFSGLIFGAADVSGEAAKIAAKNKVKLWSFESGTTEGWHGAGKWVKACSASTSHATQGKYSLKVDVTGSIDWNQDVAVNDGPFPSAINNLVEISMDVYVPKASVEGLEYQEFYVVFSSKSNNFYQSKKQLAVGANKCVFKLDNNAIKEDMWHVYFVVNTSQKWKGPIYIDNVIGRVKGDPAKVKGVIKDKKSGKGINDAYVVLGDSLVRTDSSGKFSMTVPEDLYKMEVVKYGYKKKSQRNVLISAKKKNDLGTISLSKKPKTKETATNVSVDASKVMRGIDKHALLGQNTAAWHKPNGYRDNVAIQRIKQIGATFIRTPGGDYGNLYDWKTGDVYRWDGTVNWTPEFNYMGGFVPFMMRMNREMSGKMEVMPIINVMTPLNKSIDQRVDYAIQWIQHMKDRGLKVRYVEVGNEPDNKPLVAGPKAALKKGASIKELMTSPGSQKATKWWTRISNYSKVFNWATYKIKKAFPNDNLQLMGPCPMQPMNQQRVQGEPWKAEPEAPYWVESFLKYSAKYVDVLVVHEYPLWANNNARALFKKPQTTWPVYMPKYKKWMKKYLGKEIPVALTEWNSGDENIMTAKIENALFAADYLASFIKEGGDMAFVWDLYTQKPGIGGGHGLMDSENDPTDSFSRRCHYWVFDLFYNRFGNKLIKCKSDNDDLSVYASITENNKIAILAINKTKLRAAAATISVAGSNVGGSGKAWTFSNREYVWSKALYRPIINTGPTESKVSNTGKSFKYVFPPYSITVIQLDR